MKKLNLILILLAIVAVALLVILVVVKKARLNPDKKNNDPAPPVYNPGGVQDNPPPVFTGIDNPPPNPLNANSVNGGYPLVRGSRGLEVKLLQAAVGDKIDGIFGANTELKTKTKLGFATVSESALRWIVFAHAAKPGTGGSWLGALNPALSLPGEIMEIAQKNFPLQRGNKGYYVQVLQLLLNVTPDGSFGPNTEAKLKQVLNKTSVTFQDLYNLYDARLKK